jgi:hypothetical protein
VDFLKKKCREGFGGFKEKLYLCKRYPKNAYVPMQRLHNWYVLPIEEFAFSEMRNNKDDGPHGTSSSSCFEVNISKKAVIF